MSNLKMDAVLGFVLKNSEKGDPQSVLDTIDTYAMDGSLDQKRFLMNIGPEKGKILADTIKKNKSKKILELGSFLGYSAVLIGMTIDDDGELSGRSYIYRLEYVQWAFGFFTAFNIRHYEKTNTFKDLRPVAGKDVGYEDMYNKLVTACDQIKIEEDGNFGMAVYSIFSNLPGESI